MTKLQFQSDAAGRAVANGELAPALEVVDPDIIALDIFPILVKVREERLRLLGLDLVVQQWINLALPLHVRLAGKNKHLQRFPLLRRG